MAECVFCKESCDNGQETVILREKGSESINRASEQQGSTIRTQKGQRVHTECRRVFTHPHTIARAQEKPTEDLSSPCVLRSETPTFRFGEDCLFCGKPAPYNEKKRGGMDVYPVRSTSFQESVLNSCAKRKDEWSTSVASRIAYAQDLVAADAVYHQSCNVNFRTGKQLPQHHSSISEPGSAAKKQKLGRPKESERYEAFLLVARYLEENDDEQITIGDLIEKMETVLLGSKVTAYGFTHMKNKLLQHFGDSIIITELNGKPNVVTFKRTAASILQDFYNEQKKEDPEMEKVRMINAVANLIKSDIKAIDSSNDVYPSREEMSVESSLQFIPQSLLTLLQGLFVGTNTALKIASIGQSIMQATRPRIILAPLQFGLAVEMHHHFASRFIVDSLYKHGFSCSYSEVQKFEKSAALTKGKELPEPEGGRFIQYICDNVDHNVRTLDGFGTFHGMGIISTSTPGKLQEKPVPRVTVTADEIVKVGRINIKTFKSQHTGRCPLTYKELQAMEVHDPTYHVDLLWEAALVTGRSRPAWSGMMQSVHRGNYPGKSAVQFLPMIDMDPTDMTCIFSTLTYVCDQARAYNVTPVITFDQPLWWKATMIIESEPTNSILKSIVLRLGGLHMQMSFLGSIGHIMAGSGLQEVLEVVYAGNAVKHMLSGKAISRAVRGHLLVDAALRTILVANAYNVHIPTDLRDEEEQDTECTSDGLQTSDPPEEMEVENEYLPDMGEEQDLHEVGKIFDNLMMDEDVIANLSSLDVLSRVAAKTREECDGMGNLRTAKLWLQYLEMVAILKRFIKAERTGNWMLHLAAVRDMLPYFAAAGHNMYVKSAYLYLQKMSELNETHQDVHLSFMNGFHVVRRSDRYWAGLPTDLVIEQVLMRSIKTSGGLTRGKGMTEVQRLTWVLGMPSCAEVNLAMQELTGVNYITSEQHKDTSKSRQKRDLDDTYKLIEAFKQWDPFGTDPSLHNIVSGVTAHEKVNVDQARCVGKAIIESMVGKDVSNYSFQRKHQAVTFGSKTAVAVDGEQVQVDPELLFQRLSIIATREEQEDPAALFKYELCSHPTSLFDNAGLPREAHKATLGDALWDMVKHDQTEPTGDDLHYVLDGGALLQRLPWSRGQNFESICNVYVQYVKSRYGKATIVFDGYEDGPAIKDATHCRRTGSSRGPDVVFTGETSLKMKKNEFLCNKVNKQRFLNMLSSFLEKAGCTTIHAKGDADILIAKTAVESSKVVNTVLIGDDTDLLILLCYYGDAVEKELYLKPELKANTRKHKTWNIKKTREILGRPICSRLLFVHALLGCDTTSRVFGIGKPVALKEVQKNAEFQKLADLFTREGASKKDIINAGEKALVCIYNGKKGEGIDDLRYRRFCEKVAKSSTFVEPKTLPPTSAATEYHSMRVYYQVQTWRETAGHLKPEEWGWKIKNSQLLPVQTHLPAAPEKLTKIFRCNCKTGCSTSRCSCKRIPIACTWMCGVCKGESCANSSRLEIDDSVSV